MRRVVAAAAVSKVWFFLPIQHFPIILLNLHSLYNVRGKGKYIRVENVLTRTKSFISTTKKTKRAMAGRQRSRDRPAACEF
jgi:hypothetical protein